MNTRTNPSRFDAAPAALADEPRFTLLARDPLAGFLVSIWSSMRFGDVEAAQVKFRTMLDRIGPDYWVSPDVEKGSEAIEIAMAMFAWREVNLGRWRTPPAPSVIEGGADAVRLVGDDDGEGDV